MNRRIKVRFQARVPSDRRAPLHAIEDCARKGASQEGFAPPASRASPPKAQAAQGREPDALETRAAIEVGKLLWKKDTAAKAGAAAHAACEGAPSPAAVTAERRGDLIRTVAAGAEAGWRISAWVMVDPVS